MKKVVAVFLMAFFLAGVPAQASPSLNFTNSFKMFSEESGSSGESNVVPAGASDEEIAISKKPCSQVPLIRLMEDPVEADWNPDRSEFVQVTNIKTICGWTKGKSGKPIFRQTPPGYSFSISKKTGEMAYTVCHNPYMSSLGKVKKFGCDSCPAIDMTKIENMLADIQSTVRRTDLTAGEINDAMKKVAKDMADMNDKLDRLLVPNWWQRNWKWAAPGIIAAIIVAALLSSGGNDDCKSCNKCPTCEWHPAPTAAPSPAQ